jgi:hypothetical protein
MIFADIHGKLGSDGQRAHDRSEDLLTSTAFGLLRYLPFDVGLGALLRRARVVTQTADTACNVTPNWLRLDGGLARPIEFWPRLRRGGEPDLRLTLDRGNEVVLIEVKLDSGKTLIAGADDDDLEPSGDAEEPPIDPDQLVRYWEGQQAEVAAGVRTSIIYLTAHAVPPLRDLGASLKPEKPIRLAWLSWRDVCAVAELAKKGHVGSDAATDLAALLRHKGLFEFNGFADAEPAKNLPATANFWTEAPVRKLRQERFFAVFREAQLHAWMGLQGQFFTTHREGRA